MKLHHITAICSSKTNARAFYEDLLGLRQIKSSTLDRNMTERIFGINAECEFVFYSNSNFSIEVFIIKEEFRKHPFSHNCLEVENRDSLIKNCALKGLRIHNIIKDGKPLYFLYDFDGNMFEIKEIVSQ